jgi:hypothetical protein
VQGKELIGRSYEATRGRVREAAHRFASAVMKELTGINGFLIQRSFSSLALSKTKTYS